MLDKVTKGLLITIVIELILGGGGRLVSWGPVSLRMILFVLAMIVTCIHIITGKRVDQRYRNLLIMFSGMLVIGVGVGLISGADRKLIWEDVKPLLFFYLLPFFSLSISGRENLLLIQRSIVSTSTLMAGVFICILALLNSNLIPFLSFYKLTSWTEEFFYRGEYTFFYKGLVYLCVGFLFVQILNIKSKWWILTLLSFAILLTFTRGLLFALALTYLVYFIIIRKYRYSILMILLCAAILSYGKTIYTSISNSLYKVDTEEQMRVRPSLSGTLLGDREHSDKERMRQIRDVIKSITPTSILWGHGFGNGVKSRPIHMEISYLEIFHKQGLIGIGCWGFLFFSLALSFLSAYKRNPELSLVFFSSTIFFFFQSLTNQYINNPIGLGMLMISLISLNVITEITRAGGQSDFAG